MPAVKLWTGIRWAYDVPVSNVTNVTLNDNGTDQSASLIAQLAAVDDGIDAENEQIIRLPAGRYRLDSTMEIADREWLTIEGPTTGRFTSYTDVAGDADRAHWRFTGGTHTKLRHIDIEGIATGRDVSQPQYGKYQESYFGQHGVAVQGTADNVTIEDINVLEAGGDGLYVGGTGLGSTTVTVRNYHSQYNGRQGIGLVNGTDVTIEDSSFLWCGRSGLDIEPNHDDHFVIRPTIKRVTVSSQFYPFIGGGSAGDLVETDHIVDLLMEDVDGISPLGLTGFLGNGDMRNCTIRRLTANNRSTQCMVFGTTRGTIIVEDSTVESGPSTPVSMGVGLNDVTADVFIRGNNFSGTGAASTGADVLYLVNAGVGGGIEPASITHCGNIWAGNTLNDGAC